MKRAATRLLAALLTVLCAGSSARAQTPATKPDTADEAKKADARVHFERGLQLSAEQAWDPALVEYRASLRLFPTKAALKNAALCLHNLHRYDEALDAFETLQRDYAATLNDQDRALFTKQIDQIAPFVGTVDIRGVVPGASVTIDGQDRGTTPMTSPLRVSVGSHTLRIFKSGLSPFERRIEVAGRQTVAVEARLQAPVQSGRLRVAESSGAAASVFIDNVRAGETPWEGVLPVGEHVVVLHGEGDLGTQPGSVPVRLDALTTLNLTVEHLDAELRVDPAPLSAAVAVDGVGVGRGTWQGRLRAGAHRVEVAAEGFISTTRNVQVASKAREVVRITLDRDPRSALWRSGDVPSLFADLNIKALLGLSLGGDVSDGCTGGCSHGPAFGGLAELRVGYQLPLGVGFSLDGGYAFARQTITDRPDAISPLPLGSLPPNPGTSNDDITVRGVTLGGSVSLRRGRSVTWGARIGAGVWLATAVDTRSGSYTTARGTRVSYQAGPLEEKLDARYLYLAPGLHVGWHFGRHFEVGAELDGRVLVAITQPRWKPESQQVLTGNCPPGSSPPAGCVTDGLGRYESASVTGNILLLLAPGATLRYEF